MNKIRTAPEIVVKCLPKALFAIYIALFIWMALRDVLYPGFMEPTEGDLLQHIERVSRGRTLYPQPGAEFIALPYMPVYYLLSAPFYTLFGDSFVGPRLVSSLCALASGILVVLMARRESQSTSIGCIAGLLFFSSYRIMDCCLTSVASDSLMLLLLLLGCWFWAYKNGWWADLAWSVLFGLAFWTRQHGAFYYGSAVIYALFVRKNSWPRWSILLALFLFGPISYFTLGRFLGDGFFLHTYEVPRKWEMSLWFSLRRMAYIIGCYVPLAVVPSLIFVRNDLKRGGSPLLWFLGACFASSLITMMAAGSSNNHYIPLIAVLCVTSALGIHEILRDFDLGSLGLSMVAMTVFSAIVTVASVRQYGAEHGIWVIPPFVVAAATIVYFLPLPVTRRRQAIGLALVIGQLVVASYNPHRYMPATDFPQGMTRLREEIASLAGNVIWADVGNVPQALTGRKILRCPSWVALVDLERRQGAENETLRQFGPFRKRILDGVGIYVLSNGRLEDRPGWASTAHRLKLVKDFGDWFSSVREIAYPWYGGGAYPRLLYRVEGDSSPE